MRGQKVIGKLKRWNKSKNFCFHPSIIRGGPYSCILLSQMCRDVGFLMHYSSPYTADPVFTPLLLLPEEKTLWWVRPSADSFPSSNQRERLLMSCQDCINSCLRGEKGPNPEKYLWGFIIEPPLKAIFISVRFFLPGVLMMQHARRGIWPSCF